MLYSCLLYTSKTYTVTYSGGLTPPANTTETVSCPADATNPGAPANILDACGRTVSAAFVAMEQTPDPVTCNGTIVWRYRYTACDGTTTADWTKTYTVTSVSYTHLDVYKRQLIQCSHSTR